MKIRNMRAFSLYFPYAGQRRGMMIKAGQLSMDLPTERFYDPLLQRDWRCGKIEVLLSNIDKAVLGPVADKLQSEVVEVPDDAPTPKLEAVTPMPEPEPEPAAIPAVKLDADTGEQTPVMLPAPPPVAPLEPGKKRRGRPRKDKPEDAPSAAIQQRTDTILLKALASELGVTSRAIMIELTRRGIKVGSTRVYVPKDQADMMREHFKPPYTGSPALDPANPPMRLHQVPSGSGMPETPAAPGAPSLDDLRKANLRINLGTPKFGSSRPGSKVKIEMPGMQPFGSTLRDGTPQAQRAAAEADRVALTGEQQ